MVNIIYRFCNKKCTDWHNRPDWFSKKTCFESFYKQFSNTADYRIHCIQDGHDGELTEFIDCKKNIYNFTKVNFRSNELSLSFCLDYADKISEGDFYFLEDDFLHRPNSSKALVEGINKFKLISLYDHPDRYNQNSDISKGMEEVSISNSCHWRTAESTTCTWACSRDRWEEIKTEAKKFLLDDRGFFRNLILNKKIRLWTPIQAYSTHCMNNFLSPIIDWKKINDIYIL